MVPGDETLQAVALGFGHILDFGHPGPRPCVAAAHLCSSHAGGRDSHRSPARWPGKRGQVCGTVSTASVSKQDYRGDLPATSTHFQSLVTDCTVCWDHGRQSGNMRRHDPCAGRSILDSKSPPFVDARSRLWPSRRKDRDARCACVPSISSPRHPPRHGSAVGTIKQQRFRLQLFQVQPLHPKHASLSPIWF